MWRRRKDNLKRRMMSGILACLLVATSLTNTVGIITSFAGQTANIPRVSYKYDDLKNDKGQLDKMVQINVQAENESFAPGSEMVLKVYVQNLSDQNLTGGSLKWSGKGLEEAGFLDEEEEDLFNGPGWDGEDNDSDTSDLMEELGNFSVTGLRKSVALKVDDTAAKDETEAPEQNVEIITDVETEEEEDDTSDPQTDEEGKRIRGIELAPGEVYETRFYGTVEDMDSIVTRKVTFEFLAGTDDNTVAQDKAEFTYNTGMALVLPIEFDDGPALMTNELNTMYIHTRFEDEKILDEYTWEITDEDEATPSDAERHEITVATMSNGTEDSSEGTTPANMKYSIVTYGAKLEGIEAWYDDERSGWGEMATGVSFRVKDDTEPGVYFGQVTTSIRREGKSYKTTQGFHFFVLGDGQMVLKGNINGAEIQVKGDRSSFPEGDMLSLKVTEVPAEKMDLVQEAMVQKAEELGVSVDKMKAMDIKVIADGVEQELEGEVEVTFSNLTLEKVEETIGLEDEEDIEDGEVEELEEINTNAVFGLRKASAGTEEDQAEDENPVADDVAADDSQNENGEESSLAVWHFDEDQGSMDEMESDVNENGDVVMTTEHFSIFIVVNMGQLFGEIKLTVQHWGSNINSLNGSANALTGTDDIISSGNMTHVVKEDGTADIDHRTGKEYALVPEKRQNCEIYKQDDNIIIYNNMPRINIEELSKICLANKKTEPNYEVEKIWVMEPGKGDYDIDDNTGIITPNNNNSGLWKEYTDGDEIRLRSDSTIRIWYRPVSKLKDLVNAVNFYDYNFTDGKLYTSQANAISGNEYTGSRRAETTYYTRTYGADTINGYLDIQGKSAGKSIYQFGRSGSNAVGYSSGATVNRNGASLYLNTGNKSPSIVSKIVTGFSNRNVTPNKDVYLNSNLFSDDDIISGERAVKKVFSNWKLVFNREGNTYTLTEVQDENKGSVISNLERMSATQLKWGTGGNGGNDPAVWLYSNEFWPLDKVEYSGKDVNVGNKNYPLKGVFQNAEGNYESGDLANNDIATQAHNWFFGMKTRFTFSIEEYTGPMKFYFRGDDDFWLFIDDKLAVDIGGVHSTLGETLDIKAFIENNNLATGDPHQVHTMDIVYTERGGQGSSCYMQFILPNVKPPEPIDWKQETTSVSVEKVWEDIINNSHDSIEVQLSYQQRYGAEAWSEYDNKEWTTYETVSLGAANNWSYTWDNLPKSDNYRYRIKEIGTKSGYKVSYSVDGETKTTDDGAIISGMGGSAKVINTAIDTVEVKVKKEWLDGGDTLSRPKEILMVVEYFDEDLEKPERNEWKPVPMDDEESGETKGLLITLPTVDGKWEKIVEGLPKFLNGDESKPIKYRVREVIATTREVIDKDGNSVTETIYTPLDENGGQMPGKEEGAQWSYTVHYSDNYDSKDDDKPFETVITNSYTITQKVKKVWSPATNLTTKVSKVGLYYQEEGEWKQVLTDHNGKNLVNPVKLTETNNFCYEWTDLSRYSEGNKEIKYAIFELNDKGEKIELNGIDTVNGVRYLVTTEKEVFHDQRVQLVSELEEGKTSQLSLYYKVYDTSDKKRYEWKQWGNSITLEKDKLVYEWTKVPSYTEDGKEIEYAIGQGDTIVEINNKTDVEISGYMYKLEKGKFGNVIDNTIITNSLTAKFRVAKWIDNYTSIEVDNDDKSDLNKDDFIIKVKNSEDGFETGLVLQNSNMEDIVGKLKEDKISGYIEVIVGPKGYAEYKIEEIVPKEYKQSSVFLTYISDYSAEEKIEANNRVINGESVQIYPGDDGVIVVHNTFGHKDYFHNDARVTNLFPENTSNTRQLAKADVLVVCLDAFMAEETGKERKRKLIEEDERLLM